MALWPEKATRMLEDSRRGSSSVLTAPSLYLLPLRESVAGSQAPLLARTRPGEREGQLASKYIETLNCWIMISFHSDHQAEAPDQSVKESE